MQQKSGFDYRMIACGCTLVALVPVSGWAASPYVTPEPPPPSYYDEQTATPRASGYPGYPQSHYDNPPRGWQAAPGYGQPSYGRPYYPQGAYPPAYGNPGAVQSAGEMPRQPYYTAPAGTEIKATEAAGQAPASAAIDAPAVVEQAIEAPAETRAVIPADVDDPTEAMPAPAAGEAKPQGMLEKASEKVKGLLKSDDATAAAVPAVEAPAMAAPAVTTPAAEAPTGAAPEVTAPAAVAAPALVEQSVETPAVIAPADVAPTMAMPEVAAPEMVAPTVAIPEVNTPAAEAAPAVVEQAIEAPAETRAVIPADVDDPTELMLSLIHISEPTRRTIPSRMPSSA